MPFIGPTPTPGGTVTTSFVTDAFTADQLLADPGGVAVIVHAGRDNYANVPHRYRTVSTVSGPDAATLATGDAGARYACGVVELRPLFVPTGYWMAAADGGGGDAGARFACGVVAASAASR